MKAFARSRVLELVPAFYADETSLEIEGKEHVLIAAITFEDPQAKVAEIVGIKKDLGIPLSQEIKWNQQTLPRDLRYKISDRMLYAAASASKVLIAIREGMDKQKACEMVLQQIADCYQSPFCVYLDRRLCPDIRQLWTFACSLPDPAVCATLQETESSRDQLIQCVDVFAGLFKTAVEHHLRGIVKRRKSYDPILREEIEDTVSGHILVSARYCLPGDVEFCTGKVGGEAMPFKDAWGQGLRLESSISEKAKEVLRQHIAVSYVGCMH